MIFYVKAVFGFGVLGTHALAVVVINAQALKAEIFRTVVWGSVQYGQLAVDVGHYHSYSVPAFGKEFIQM